MLPVTGAINMARNRVAQGFRRIISGDSEGTPEWVRQLADGVDSGYFGPGSAAWTVHGSLPTLVGGVRALLMQALHPGALAGVVQHSRYEEDPLGRLAGTTQWLTVVTFGDTAMADRECARVRGMHRKVRGMYPVDGELREYSAGDPDSLRWVHVAFTDSFLATHRVWGGPIPGAKTPTCGSGRKPESSSVSTIRRGLLPNSRSRSAASAPIYEAIKRRGTRSTSSGRRRCRFLPKALQRFVRGSGRDYPRVASASAEVAAGADHRSQARCVGPTGWDVASPGPDVAVDAQCSGPHRATRRSPARLRFNAREAR